MNRTDKLLIHVELYSLTVDYWHDVDRNWGRNAPSYFTENGVFHAAGRVYSGRDQIEKFYRWRETRGARIARHLVTNFQVIIEDESHATTHWVLCLYAADGVPVLPSAPPIQTADVTDVCVREKDGTWRFVSRTLVPLFEGGAPTTVPPAGTM